ncbi:hypothetical protein LZ30DRAFT_220960 [Colletotrichum cereale]|nr:hypothetical protein LZ30DRAFT_220960 [Colletotrichum cereale]
MVSSSRPLPHIPLDSICVGGKSSVDRPAETPKLDKHKKMRNENMPVSFLGGWEGENRRRQPPSLQATQFPLGKGPRENPVYQIPPRPSLNSMVLNVGPPKNDCAIQRWPNPRFLACPCPNGEDLLPTYPLRYSRPEDALLDYTFRFMVVKYVCLQNARVTIPSASSPLATL